jgi:hypothetical protein
VSRDAPIMEGIIGTFVRGSSDENEIIAYLKIVSIYRIGTSINLWNNLNSVLCCRNFDLAQMLALNLIVDSKELMVSSFVFNL